MGVAVGVGSVFRPVRGFMMMDAVSVSFATFPILVLVLVLLSLTLAAPALDVGVFGSHCGRDYVSM